MNQNQSVELEAEKPKLAENQRMKTQIVETVTKYEGDVLDDKKDGYGVEHNTKFSSVYQGFWKENMYDGEGCFYEELTKCFYKGKWQANEKDLGIQIYPNGDQYEGQYKDGKFNGKGCLLNDRFGYRYEGDFKEGKRHGYGRETYKGSSFYEGEFKQNLKHGKGKLQFPDKSYYEGDFVRGLPYGFGVHVSYSKEKSISIMPLSEKELTRTTHVAKDQDGNIVNFNTQLTTTQPPTFNTQQTLQSEQDFRESQIMTTEGGDDENVKELEEYYYEGEFVEGYKQGIGRYFEPDGSYYYCWWEFDRKTGEIIYYQAANHQWFLFSYRNVTKISLLDYYASIKTKHLDEEKYIILIQQEGFPDIKLDSYKDKIDQCGIIGEFFEDQHFPPVVESTFKIKEEEQKEVPNIEFIRLTEHEIWKNKKNELFHNPIKPGQLELNQLSDYELITCLEALTRYPHLLFKVFTVKYDLDTILERVCY